MPNWSKVASLSALEPGQPLGLEVEGKAIGLYRLGERVYALGDICTHAFALLSGGFIEGDEIECPLHFARFDILTGRCTAGPAEEDVASIPVEVREADVYVDLDRLPPE